MIDKYQQQILDAENDLLTTLKGKIHDWETYKAFNEYAINELDGTQLDHWFNGTSSDKSE